MDYKKSEPFYHTKEWKKVRQVALMRDGGMCQACMDRMRAGYGVKPRRATMVHHIIPYKERPDLALNMDNLRSLCYRCHEMEHPERRWGREQREKETTGHRMRVIKV